MWPPRPPATHCCFHQRKSHFRWCAAGGRRWRRRGHARKNGFHPRKTTFEPGGWKTTSIEVSTLTDCNTCSPNMMGCWSFTQLSLCEIDMSHFKLSYGLLSQCLTITCACIQCIAMQCIGSWSKIENINLQTFFLHLPAKYRDTSEYGLPQFSKIWFETKF